MYLANGNGCILVFTLTPELTSLLPAFSFRLIFAPAEKVDQIWSSIASASTSLGGHDDLSPRPLASLVSGPLHETPAYLAKVSTSTEEEKANAQHLICVYLPDVYDKAAVTEVSFSRCC